MERLTRRIYGCGIQLERNNQREIVGAGISDPALVRAARERLAEYEDTDMTPEEIHQFIAWMKDTCEICGCNHDKETAPKVNGCQYTDCGCHKWRAKWYGKEQEHDV